MFVCDCREEMHIGFECGSFACNCHGGGVPTDIQTKDDDLYLSITFCKVDRFLAEVIIQAARDAAGTTSFSVYYDTGIDVEEEEGESNADLA